MIDKKKELRKLYEEAIYWHLVHNGRKIKRDSFAINWNEDEL